MQWCKGWEEELGLFKILALAVKWYKLYESGLGLSDKCIAISSTATKGNERKKCKKKETKRHWKKRV